VEVEPAFVGVKDHRAGLGAGNGHTLRRGKPGRVKGFVGGFQVEGRRGVRLPAHAQLRRGGPGQKGQREQEEVNCLFRVVVIVDS